VYKFLGVNESHSPNLKRLNTSKNDGKPRLEGAIRDRMKAFFEEDIKLLQTLVDFDVTKWLD